MISIVMLGLNLSAQVADITEGCVPLTVQFSSDPLSDYFWDFDDGGSSNNQSPEHIFTTPGTYTVSLKQGSLGQSIGTVIIQVFADPVITISYDQPNGCIPSEVTFTPSITLDPNVTVLEYQWIFGDGNISNEVNPTHIYTDRGTFTVSLSIKTDKTECDYLEIFPDLIDAFGITSNFSFDSPDLCKVPASVLFRYIGDNIEGITYNWEFGNGETSSEQNPPIVTYNEEGEYQVVLVATSPSGCVSTDTSIVITNEPMVNLIHRDSVCVGETFTSGLSQSCKSYVWEMPESFRPNIQIHLTEDGDLLFEDLITGTFNEAATNVFSVICVTENGCKIDTSFTMHSIQPTAEFTMSPNFGCSANQILDFSASDLNLAGYWVNGDSLTSPTWSDTIICPVRDSFYANRPNFYGYELAVQDYLGCRDTTVQTYRENKTEACFLAIPNNGCVPLDVRLLNITSSEYNLTTTDWDLGDGTQVTTIGRDSIFHTYSEIGDYYVKMVTRNTEGCQDTSAGVWIHVGDEAFADLEIITVGDCLDVNLEFSLLDASENIDSWSFGGIVNSHCPLSKTYPLSVIRPILTLEDNGCFTEIPIEGDVDIDAPFNEPQIHYTINCGSPFDINLNLFDPLLPGETLVWTIDGVVVSSQQQLLYTFETTGNHTIQVELFSADPDCGSAIDIEEVVITDITAAFDVDSTFCKGDIIVIDASQSIDQFTESGKGYTYTIGNSRPFTIGLDTFAYQINTAGWQTVTLKVVDRNGCVDILSKEVLVHEIEADFSLPTDLLCVNGTYIPNNLSLSDTTFNLTYWTAINTDTIPVWDPLSTEFEPAFDYDQLVNEIVDSVLTLTLAVEDNFGCRDTVEYEYDIYDIGVEIAFNPGPGVCLGTEIDFNFEQTNLEQGGYSIDWDFGDGTVSQNQEVAHTYLNNGLYEVSLVLEENEYNCIVEDVTLIDVINPPIANFTTSIDNVDPICYPTAVQFFDQSIVDGFALYRWDMSGDLVSNINSPIHAFGKGEQTVTLTLISLYGCMDSISQSFTLVGPEGVLLVENDTLCRDDVLTGRVIDLEDVNFVTWDLGDGTVVNDVEDIVHQYTFAPPSGETVLKVVLRSNLNGCESILEHPVVIGIIDPSFEFDIEEGFCGSLVNFIARDSIADIFNWDFGNGTTGTGSEISQNYPDGGSYLVGLTVTDQLSGCVDELSEEIMLEELDAGFTMPNLFTPNGDSTNDFFNWVGQGIDEAKVEVVTFRVYNRWGNLVYDNDTPDLGWDGKHIKDEAPTDVYGYYIELEIADCGLKSKKGNVTLIR